MFGAKASFNTGRLTESADTAIVGVIPAIRDLIPNIVYLAYTSLGTAHTLTVMVPLEPSGTVDTAIAAAGTALSLTAQPSSGNIADNDFVVVELDNITTHWPAIRNAHASILSSTSGSDATIAAVPTGRAVASGNKVWFFGAAAEAGHPAFAPATSARTELPTASNAPIVRGKAGCPLILHSNNATAAGIIEACEVIYTAV